MKSEMTVFYDAGGMRATIQGEIDHHTAKEIRTKLDSAIFEKNPEVVTLDFGKVNFMDSSGIALIIGRAEACRTYGGTLEITGLVGTMRRVVMLSGIRRIKNIRIV